MCAEEYKTEKSVLNAAARKTRVRNKLRPQTECRANSNRKRSRCYAMLARAVFLSAFMDLVFIYTQTN